VVDVVGGEQPVEEPGELGEPVGEFAWRRLRAAEDGGVDSAT
jgi:hypothetical protein